MLENSEENNSNTFSSIFFSGDNMTSVDVTILGDMNIDIIVRFDGELVDDISLITSDAKIAVGGVGANIASNLAYMGLKTRILGAVGSDILGRHIVEELNNRKIDTIYVQKIREATTGFMIVLVNSMGRKTIIGSRGANKYFKLEENEIRQIVASTRHIHVSGYSALNVDRGHTLLRILYYSKENNKSTSLDLEGIAQYYPEFIQQLNGLLDYVFINRVEAKYLCKHKDLVKCLAGLLKTINAKALFLKEGEKGSRVFVMENNVSVKEFRVEPYKASKIIDCTGAGDAYNAAVIASILSGKSFIEASLEGNKAGARACGCMGGFCLD